MTTKRLEFFEKAAASTTADAFSLYALAMEYRKERRAADALTTFVRLRARDAEYLPMYLMAGQLLIDEGREAEARPWLEAGIELATKTGNSKAKNELVQALESCDAEG
ncbi:MAG TPA: tetratricopeptide repeat protein [Polyangiaceae bacterium]|jgi:tetratricopeptide (TPR) repeat protein|nr:tetratricopeptide repeat protein [Polyangiaceae bacterium]